jgi:hypothetical protein
MAEIVYRVECEETGIGPYQEIPNKGMGICYAPFSVCECGFRCKEHRQHRPTKYYDKNLEDRRLTSDMHFGFETLDDLKKWFSEDIRAKLKRMRFVVTAYLAEEAYFGSHKEYPQAMFNKATAQLFERIELE